MKNKLWSTLLSVVLVSSLLLVSACSSNNSNGASSQGDTSSNANTKNEGKSSNGERVVIRSTMYDAEMTPELVAEFEESHPNIKIERIDSDYNKLMAMMAAGNAPDIIRAAGVTEVPGYVIKDMALDLTPYFESSTVFKQDDFLPIVNQFRFDKATGEHGKGAIYGFPKDWSPDYTVYYNKKMFEEAGVSLPSSTEAMSWKELIELGKQLTKKNGEKVTQYGLVYYNGQIAAQQDFMNLQLLQIGKSMFSSDFGSADLTTPEIEELFNFWVDATRAGVGPSPLHQETDWGGQLFVDNKAAMIITGYWFSGFLKDNPLTKDRLDDFAVAPAPVMENGTRISPSSSGTGAIIHSSTQHPKEAWEVFEWFFGGKPAEDRAKAGYGLPATKTLMTLLPQDTDFNKMSYDFVQNELKYSEGYLPFNPFLSYQAVNSVFDKHFTPVYFDKDTVDGAAKKMTEELNTLINEGKQLIGAK
ncbi:multiple sugar transport system substrate-binding protein [Paenibacillus anaericanus]|uniref:ABC transporter substrate-binding protein n=1 Tax=Paenibacillus anaericanus TaxID=170367 RepID=UPI00278B8095|nr:sugar ABC transporter substrate-binding protein [Paenibacillus anaericanus]MDQ0090742.1 multiple sugar transport system substrate-binding protein [Paenibacillus anaericanus]